jgi:hypothetical protein
MAKASGRPINAPAGEPDSGGVPWLGLAVIGLLVLILATLVGYLIFGIGREGDGPRSGGTEGAGPSPGVEVVQSGRVLGLPLNATRNTTRVPGDDPVDISLATLLASYPAVGPGSAPPAVTLASADQWQAAVVAASLSAEPISAPLMLAPSGKLSSEGSELLDTLAPVGSPQTGEKQVFTIGEVAPPSGYDARKVPGDDPAKIAVDLAELKARLTEGPPDAFVVTSAEDAAYAAPAATWAARSGDVILFTDRNSVPEATAAFLRKKENRSVPIFVLGPTDAVSAEVVKRLGKLAGSVERVPGSGPVEAALELVRFSSGSFGWNLNDPGHGYTLIRSDRPMDGVAATPLSTGGTWPALLMTDDASELPDDVLEYLLDVQPGYTTDPTRALYNHVWIIGTESTIDLDQQAEVDRAAELTLVETTG